MRLASVTLNGVKGIGTNTVVLDPVTLIVGPNGSGKTTVLGGIQYALTGRFPGVPGATAEDLQVLAGWHGRGFDVSVRADNGVLVTRGLHGGKHSLVVDGTSERPKNKTETENLLSRTFGNVDLYADAFDVKRGTLHVSDEKRKAWVSAVCSGAVTTWNAERLIAQVGPGSADWNPHLDPSPLVCVELHITRLDEALRAAREVVRDSQKVVDSIAAPLTTPTEADVEAAYARLGKAGVMSLALHAYEVGECPLCGECATQQMEEFGANADPAAIAREDKAAFAALAEIIKQRTLGDEQASHAKAVDAAKARVDDLKSLIYKLKEARMAILHDAVAPLRAALADLTMLTGSEEGPATVSVDGDTLTFACGRGGRLVPFEAMSSGEKLRLTIAVLVAVSRIRRQPWTGIFVDNFESVYPEDDRWGVIADVVRAQRAGFIDNAVFAGAMPRPTGMVDGVRVIERARP
jgi:energy-coupling factor transporter ATP-binding protein EcfA2